MASVVLLKFPLVRQATEEFVLRDLTRLPQGEPYYMMDFKANEDDDNEVRGIVISCGNRARLEPRFSAYVWSDTDDAERESGTKAA